MMAHGALAPIGYTILGCMICACAQVMGKAGAESIGSLRACVVRFAGVIPLSWLVMYGSTGSVIPQISGVDAAKAAVIAILGWGVGSWMFFYVATRDGMSRVGPVANSLPVWSVALSMLMLGDRWFPAMGPVLVLLMAGIVMMAPAAKEGLGRWKPAVPIAFGLALIWAFTTVMNKTFIHGIPYPAFVFVKFCGAGVFFIVAGFFSRGRMSLRGFLISYLSGVALIVADILLTAGLDGLPASVFSPLYSTIIPFTFLGSVVFLGEKPRRRHWTGMIFIFAAAVLCGYYGTK